MKKLFLFVLIVAMVFGMAFSVYADATKARSATLDKSPTPPGGISDLSSGDTLKIDSEGRAYIRDMGGHTVYTGYGDALVYTGSCMVYHVYMLSQDSNGYAEIYDRVTAGDKTNVKFDPQSATAKIPIDIPVGGCAFSTGIYVDAYDNNTLVTIIYDPL